jgi:MerR family transcriptional regulator, copper efflux regulator
VKENETKPLTVGRLARAAKLNLETVRYYERRGLLPKPKRGESGYRLYSGEAVRRLRFIRRAKELGFSLQEICELLSLRVSPKTTHDKVRARAQAKIDSIELRLRSLGAIRNSLRELAKACSRQRQAGNCPILECLDREE